MIKRRKTRSVFVGDLIIGSESHISVQSMCATRTQDLEATIRQIRLIEEAGADIIRIAIDSKRDVDALAEIRKSVPKSRLVIDLQENYRLITLVAPYVQKVRYNPGHLHHHEKSTPVKEKVRFLTDTATKFNLALRIGVNFGSLDPSKRDEVEHIDAALASIREHIGYMDDFGFKNFVVSLKSSDPNEVIDINKAFVSEFQDIPLHLGVTEAGMLPMGEIKTRIAFENLLALGIGDTVRVSLTLPNTEKNKEIEVGKKIIEDVYAGRFRSVPRFVQEGLNIISCPSCSRVENEAFVELAKKVKEVTSQYADKNLTVAVMGCRVNGPGETDDADLGLWCAPHHVNLKKRGELLGAFSYDEIVPKLLLELESLAK